MESPLSFDSTENFRKKLLLKNLKPYKVQNGFTSNETTERREIQLIDYAVKDSGNIDDIGNKQEKILFPQNKYGPTNSNQTYGNVVDINKNLNTESNQGSYSVTSTFNSKLNQTGNYQETLLYVQNLYGPTFENGSFGNVVDINKDLQFNTNLGDYRISLTFENKLKQLANQKETDLIVKNIYKPQGQNGYGDTVWFINNDLTTITNGEGEYNINDTFNNRLQLIGNQQEIFLKVKNVYKSTNDSFGTPAYWINNDQTIETIGSGQYNISDTFLSKLEVKGNDKEIELRAINKYTPNNGTDYGSTKWSITNLITLGSNQGSYTTSNSNNSLLELNGVQERDILFPVNQYGPIGGQSQTPIVFSNIPPLNNNGGNYKPTSSIGSTLEVKGEQYRDNSNPLNQYGSESQVNDPVNINSNLNTHTNEGEYTFTDTNGSPLEVGGLIEENKAYVKNKYVPGNGSYEALTINDLQIQTTSQKYYNSAQSFVFVPSDYTPISILLNDNPTGTNGSLSQDSTLAFLGAKQLQRQFKFRIASELISETIGRVNNLTSSVDPISGEVSVQPNLDPFNAVGILSGNVPVLSRNYQVTSPNTIVGQAVGFAAKITGLYSPYSVIPGQYFDYPQKRLLNQILTNPVSILSNTVMGNISKITRLNIKKGSDLLLAYTSPATRDLLWGQLFYNEYRPDYRANSITNPNLFSPKPNFYVGDRGTSIEDMLTPINALPEYKDGNSLTSNVYGFSDVSKEYEGDKLTGVFFGINSKSFFDGNSPITSSFSWNSTKSFFKPGKLVGNKGGQKNPTNQTSNIYERVEYINSVIKRFSSLTSSQKHDWLNSDSVNAKIKHNYELLINTNWNHNEIDALIE